MMKIKEEVALDLAEEMRLSEKRPQLPTAISKMNVGTGNLEKYFLRDLESRKMTVLPKGEKVGIKLLHVDENDTLHVRFHLDESLYHQPGTSGLMKLDTFQKLQNGMEGYYGISRNRDANRAGNGWLPAEGEVAVVYGKRNHKSKAHPLKVLPEKVFQRAVITAVLERAMGVSVMLLDDVGSGDVPMTNCYRIQHNFTLLAPQVFQCELAGLEYFGCHKNLIRNVLGTRAIRQTWTDCADNTAQLEWTGLYKDGKPVVQVEILKLVSRETWIDLKSYVVENLDCIMAPQNILSDVYKRPCEVLCFDSNGYMWIQLFTLDCIEILKRIDAELERIQPLYEEKVQKDPINMRTYFGRFGWERSKESEEKLRLTYVTTVGTKTENGSGDKKEVEEVEVEKTLRRVQLLHYNKEENKFEVQCLDTAMEWKCPASKLQPLYRLCPDLAYYPPMAFKVHLYKVKDFKDEARVKDLLDGRLEVRLKYMYPEDTLKPEVELLRKETETENGKGGEDKYTNVGEYMFAQNLATRFQGLDHINKNAVAKEMMNSQIKEDPGKFDPTEGTNEYQCTKTFTQGSYYEFNVNRFLEEPRESDFW